MGEGVREDMCYARLPWSLVPPAVGCGVTFGVGLSDSELRQAIRRRTSETRLGGIERIFVTGQLLSDSLREPPCPDYNASSCRPWTCWQWAGRRGQGELRDTS
jgi:hypothetical protein